MQVTRRDHNLNKFFLGDGSKEWLVWNPALQLRSLEVSSRSIQVCLSPTLGYNGRTVSPEDTRYILRHKTKSRKFSKPCAYGLGHQLPLGTGQQSTLLPSGVCEHGQWPHCSYRAKIQLWPLRHQLWNNILTKLTMITKFSLIWFYRSRTFNWESKISTCS